MAYMYSEEFTPYNTIAEDVILTLNWSVSNSNVLNNTTYFEWELLARQRQAGIGINDLYNIRFNNFKIIPDGGSSRYIGENVENASLNTDGTDRVIDSGSTYITTKAAYGVTTFSIEFNLRAKPFEQSDDSSYWGLNTTFNVDIPTPTVVTTDATEFNDEGNPTIKYQTSSYLKYYDVAKTEACISFTGGNDDVPYREITKPTSSSEYSYTFELTDEERATLRAGASSTITPVRFYIKTTRNDGIEAWSYVTRNLTIINGEPVLAPTVKDVNARTVYLTGNENKFVKYCSHAQFDTGAQGTKEATIVSQYVLNGSQTVKDTNTGTIQNIDSNTFYFGATDSRGLSVKDFIVVDLVPYTKLTSYIDEAALDTDGNLTFTVKGNYYNGSFGTVNNSLEVEYSLRENDGDISWTIIEPTINSDYNTYSATHTITGLNYKSKYTLTVNVIDEITSIQTNPKIISSNPIFDWSETDFRHHTDVYLNTDAKLIGYDANKNELNIASVDGEYRKVMLADSNGDTEIYGDTINLIGNSIMLNGEVLGGASKVLWSGASHMNGDQSAVLDDLISNQTNGIVLVFSLYRNEAAEDVSINSFFISKKEVELLSGAPHSFFMLVNAGFSILGAKYLYIYDNLILGHEGNTSSSSNSGITFNNSNYVLRYVIGV